MGGPRLFFLTVRYGLPI